MKIKFLRVIFLIITICIAGLASAENGEIPELSKENPVSINHKEKKIYLYTERNPALKDKKTSHFGIVYYRGRQAKNALFHAYIEPLNLFSILHALGAVPGDNLTEKSFGKKVAGSSLDVKVIYQGKEYEINSVIYDASKKGFDIRFGGNKKAQRKSESGCILCLESCYMGIMSNASYPMISNLRKFIRTNSRFFINKDFASGDDGFIFVFTLKGDKS